MTTLPDEITLSSDQQEAFDAAYEKIRDLKNAQEKLLDETQRLRDELTRQSMSGSEVSPRLLKLIEEMKQFVGRAKREAEGDPSEPWRSLARRRRGPW